MARRLPRRPQRDVSRARQPSADAERPAADPHARPDRDDRQPDDGDQPGLRRAAAGAGEAISADRANSLQSTITGSSEMLNSADRSAAGRPCRHRHADLANLLETRSTTLVEAFDNQSNSLLGALDTRSGAARRRRHAAPKGVSEGFRREHAHAALLAARHALDALLDGRRPPLEGISTTSCHHHPVAASTTSTSGASGWSRAGRARQERGRDDRPAGRDTSAALDANVRGLLETLESADALHHGCDGGHQRAGRRPTCSRWSDAWRRQSRAADGSRQHSRTSLASDRVDAHRAGQHAARCARGRGSRHRPVAFDALATR